MRHIDSVYLFSLFILMVCRRVNNWLDLKIIFWHYFFGFYPFYMKLALTGIMYQMPHSQLLVYTLFILYVPNLLWIHGLYKTLFFLSMGIQNLIVTGVTEIWPWLPTDLFSGVSYLTKYKKYLLGLDHT